MFRDEICSTPLTGSAADWFFSENRIEIGGRFGRIIDDYTFQTTLRAFMIDKPDTYIRLATESVRVTQLNSESVGRYIDNEIERTKSTNREGSTLIVLRTSASPSDVKEAMDNIDTLVTDNYSLVKKPTISMFFGSKFGVYVYQNEEARATLVCTSNIDNQRAHWLQCVIPMLLPWYFKGDGKRIELSEKDQAIANSLNGTDSGAYLEVIKKIYDDYNIKSQYQNAQLRNFITRAKEQEVENLRSAIKSIEIDINDCFARISEYTAKKEERVCRLFGIESKINGQDNDMFTEYLQSNKFIGVHSIDGSTITLIGSGYFEYWDDEPLKNAIDSKQSFVYTTPRNITGDDVALFLKTVFIDRKIKLRTCGAVYMNIARYDANGCSGVDYYAESAYDNCLPNPHIRHFGCIGDYRRDIIEALNNSDYISASESILASSRTMNSWDSTVFQRFIYDIDREYNEGNRKCVEFPDGTNATIKETIERLKEENNG